MLSQTHADREGTTQRNLVLGALVLALAALAAWQLGWFHREDPAVAEFKELAAKPRSAENRQAMRTAFEAQTKGMSEEERFGFFEKMAPVFMPIMARQFEVQYDAFMKLSPADRIKKLDADIDKMRARQKAGQGGPGGPPGGRPQPSPAKMEEFQKKMLDWTTPDQRAKFEDGIRQFNDRMQQRGYAPVNGPGGGVF